MAAINVEPYLRLIPEMRNLPKKNLRISYDDEADVLYINFREHSVATDSEMTEDDVIIRYDGDEITGFTVLHAEARVA
jgi:uncharacterized protein YuzE